MTAKETEDLEFIYDDADCYENEISELYTYTEEEKEFKLNQTNFVELLKTKDFKTWTELEVDEKTSLILHIIQVSELTNKSNRFKAMTWILYLAQGVFGECSDNQQQIDNCRLNCFLLYKLGLFTTVQELLIMEINSLKNADFPDEKKSTLLSLADCQELRYLLNILYTMVETLRRPNDSDTEENIKLRSEFLLELEQSLCDPEPFFIILFNMVLKFCSQPGSNLPMRKVLLLLWKLLLTMLGGVRLVQEKKEAMRKDAGLSVLEEDPIVVMREMKASTPPTSATDILEMGPGKRRNRKYDFDSENVDSDLEIHNKTITNDVQFEEEKVTIIDEEPSEESAKSGSDSGNESDTGTLNGNSEVTSDNEKEEEIDQSNAGPPPGTGTPMPNRGPTLTKDSASIAAKLLQIRKEREQEAEKDDVPVIKIISGLPWIPKAKEKDLEAFLNMVRIKFIGYSLPGDLTTVAGLPNPTQDSINILRKHVFTSLSELQVKKEAEMLKYPLTIGKDENIPDTVAERVYQAMLLQLPQYIIALLKILLAAAPTSKAKTDSINILSDVLPEDMPTNPVASLRLGIDVNRHREVIVKAVSGLLLLLLKHFKQSHIYQFEYASQHLVFANCIPLVLKFFNQNIVAYVTTKNTIPSLEFPNCVIGERVELTAEVFEGMDAGNVPCWRNLFSSINLMRILNKLVKSKHSRTMMLVVFKSAPILKRALKVRQAMFQLYVLKLLKIQTKYLGRAWRKTNMKTMSAIYQKVRHHLNDDWAFGNDVDARPWDFQQEESSLRAFVERFNIRRYKKTGSQTTGLLNISCGVDEDYEPVDNNLQNLLQEEVEMPPQFNKSYEVWLEREVYSANTDWDQLLKIQCVQ